MMLKSLGKTMLIGLLTVLPVAVTVYIMVWLGSLAEAMGALLIPELVYVRGMGIALGLAAIFGIGVLAQQRLFAPLGRAVDRLLLSLPVVKTIYGSVKDLTDFFDRTKKKDLGQVVMVRFGEQKVLGLLTRQTFEDLPGGIAGPDQVAVYFPMSYQIGGYTLILDRQRVEPIDMPVEEAMRYALTAGIRKQPPPPDVSGTL